MATLLLVPLLGAVIAAITGTMWYSPVTPMGKLHMKYLGFDKLSEAEQKAQIEKAKPEMPKLYGAQMVLSYINAFAVSFIVTQSVRNGVPLQFALGFIVFNWLCFIVPVLGTGIIWGNIDRNIAVKKWVADSLYHIVTMLLIGLVASLFA